MKFGDGYLIIQDITNQKEPHDIALGPAVELVGTADLLQASVVEHGHAYDSETVRERYRADARFFRERFGFRVRPSRFSALKGFAAELRRDLAWMGAAEEREAGALGRALGLRWAQVWAQRRGSRGPLGSLPERRDVPRPEDLGADDGGADEDAA